MKKFLLSLCVMMLTCLGTWAQYSITYNGTSATITEESPGLTLEAIVSDINTNHSDVVNFSLPSTWTKEQVNTFAQGVTNKKSISKDTYGSVDVWSYIDPNTSASTSYTGSTFAGSAIDKDAEKTYGKLNSYQVVPTAENISYVKSVSGEVYTVSPTTPILYLGGSEYGVEGSLVDLYAAYMYNGEKYIGELMALEGGNAYGNTGSAVAITLANGLPTYNDGSTKVYLGSDVYVGGGKNWYLSNTSDIVSLKENVVWHKNNTNGNVVATSDIVNIGSEALYPYGENGPVAYYCHINEGGYEYDENLFPVTAYIVDGGEHDGEAYTNTIYTKLSGEEGKFGYLGTNNYELTDNTGNPTNYVTETYVLYTGRLYKDADDNTVGGDGTDIALTTALFTDEDCTLEYPGPATEDNKKGAGVTFLLSKSYTYTYTDLTGTEHTSNPFASKQTLINLSGDELYIALANDPINTKIASELIVYATADGDFKAFADAMTSEEKTAVTKIAIVGNADNTDLNFSSFTTLNTIDIANADVTDDEAKLISTNNNTTINIVDKKNLSYSELVARYTGASGIIACVAGVFSEKTPAADELTEVSVLLKDVSRVDFLSNANNFQNVVLGATDGNIGSKATVESILSKVNALSGVVNLVLSDIAVHGANNYDLSALSGTSVKRVILPNVRRNDFTGITNASPAIVLEEVCKDQGGDDKKVLVSSPAAGSLAAIKDYHYYSGDINAAERQVYFGEIGANDIEWFDGVKVSQLDLSAINTSDAQLDDVKAALHDLTNNTIEYVVFPDLKVKPVDPLYTDFLANCPNVIAIGQYTSTDKTFNAYSKEAGKISLLTEMLADLTANNASIKNAKISGSLNAKDLNGGSSVVDANGHYTETGGTGAGALVSVLLESLDLKDAEFYDYENEVEHFEDMSISAFGIFDKEAKYTQSVILPTSEKVTVIPKGCLNGIREIHDLCIPYNIKEIRTSAFEFAGINHITCTDALGDVIDYGAGTYALPAQLKLIQTNAFNVTEPLNTHDIYVLARIAPKCETHSFATKNTWGDGGFMGNSAHPISRANYKNGVNLISILHFPTALPDSEKKKYTDITRKYSLADETGATDDDGNLWMWPHHGQLYRSYDQAIAGVIWDDWRPTSDPNFFWMETGTWDPSTSTDKNAKDDARALATNGVVNGGGSNGWAEGKDASIPDSYDYDYVGWHEFVLTGSTNYSGDPEPKSYWNFSKFKKQDWYTLCVPFNMTKTDLARVFGALEHEAVYYTAKEIANAVPGDDAYGKTTANVKVPAVTETVYPIVVTLAGVTRDVETQHIQLQLSENLIEKKLSVEEDGTVTVALSGSQYKPVYSTRTDGDEEVIVEANKPYFILPYLPEYEKELANAGKRAVEYTPLDPADGTDAHVPYTDHHVNVLNAEQTKFLDWQDQSYDAVPGQPYTYYFVGTYLTQDMPLHAYYLGSKSGKSTVFRNVNGKTWTQLTTIIGGVASEGTGVEIIGGGVASGGSDVTNYKVSFTPEEDFTFNQKLPTQVKSGTFAYGMVTDEGETTGIMSLNEDGSMTMIPTNSKVYNMNGQFVGTSLNNLSKGLYLVNGKKFIVK